jgi:Flp pilus assembly protein TadD
MSRQSIAKAAVSSLVLGTAFFGALPIGQQARQAQAAAPKLNAQAEGRLAKSVKASMLKGRTDRAVAAAEQLVSIAPYNTAWRQLLGEAYLAAGRFQSAATSFNDALTLNPANSQAALKLSLALTAVGDVGNARSLLDAHKASLSPADYGLAIALAGDPQAAVQALESAVRGGWTDPRTRQNLALAYALSGRWVEARVTASQDVAPNQLDQRMTEWASLSRPRTAWDQVAGVLGVTARLDRGQPAELALNSSALPSVQTASSEPRAIDVIVAQPDAPAETVQVAAAEPERYEAPRYPEVAPQQIVMAPRREVVQRVPVAEMRQPIAAPVIKAETRPMKKPVKAIAESRIARAVAAAPVERAKTDRFVTETRSQQKQKPTLAANAAPKSTVTLANGKSFKAGEYAVQLGAFGDKTSAQAAWGRVAAKVPELTQHKPVTSRATVNGKAITRLASAGFPSRPAAESACAKARSAGQDCFIRIVPAQELASWVALDATSQSVPVKLAQRKSTAPAKPVKVTAARPNAPVRPEIKIASR